MPEYIERKNAVDAIMAAYNRTREIIFASEEAINRLPVADAAEVKHASWKLTEDGAAYCTACKQKMNPFLYGYGYCALCGAQMDGDRE